MTTPTSGRGADLYAVLGVGPDADRTQVRRAYRRQALALHPDRNPEPDATARFRAVAEAYAILADPVRRDAYDTARTPPGPGTGGPGPARPFTPPSPAKGPAHTTSAIADYTPAGEPVAHTDYAPTSGYAPPPPPPGCQAPRPAQGELLPAGWPVGRIDHRRLVGRLLLGVWRLAPLPAGRIAAGAVVAATLAAAALAVTSRNEMPLESRVIGFLAVLALACWTVRALTFAVLHLHRRAADWTRR
ncbi:Chaperone protein DnaJ [Pseudonocardia sp. Ae717_Ps2]|uniref:J domain-containing protein n=1 Tax=Pseudonocardia sp. Ae717_Ps2 TaxID=1885573 RepID=UPI00094AE37E|nr:J domain-containing protein [Pseudonocardia sp. Ae717_Ps2]OLM28546.1 Chaperone protein DnaJ [Pseudonocardia sp. Ae717_Ps2]OLM28687.1 Chaperone protein DnaJ [Pseudonocardia sp. Ae717_Ps2]